MNTRAPEPGAAPDFEALFAAIPHACLVFTPDLVIVAASDAYLSLTMRRREGLVGRNLFEAFPDNPQAHKASEIAARASIAIAIDTGRPHLLWRQRYDIPSPAEQRDHYDERYWNIRNHPVQGPTDSVRWIIQSVEDVTEEVCRDRLAQERVRLAEQRFAATFEQKTFGMVSIALDGRILEANERFCELLGFSLDELRALTIHDVTCLDDLPASLRLSEALASGAIPHYTIEKRYICRDKSLVWVNTSRSLVRDVTGAPVCFIAVIEDITAKKATEGSLKDREAYLRSILDTVPDGMILIDESGTIRVFSHAAERLFGHDAEAVIGQNVKLLMPSGDRERHDSYIRGYVATDVPRIIGIGRVVTGCRKDGSRFSLHLSVGEIKLDNQRLFVGFMRDLTERQRTEARLQELQSELVHVSRFTALGEMASALAHELNQPLTAATNYLRGARRILDLDPGGRLPLLTEAIEEAASQTLRAGQIIRRLRDFVARGESERSTVEVRALIEEASALALVGAAERGVRVCFDFEPGISTVYADRIQVQQVLLNLIRNAIEAMEDSDRRELTIAASTKPEGMIEISVHDTGPGLVPEVETRLFQPFVTTKSTGMGVGLSICRTIVEAHEGVIAAVANPDGGTTFRFTLRTLDAEQSVHA